MYRFIFSFCVVLLYCHSAFANSSELVKISTYIDSANFYFKQDGNKASYFALKALKLSRKNNRSDFEANSLMVQGKSYKYLNLLDSALVVFQEALNILDSLPKNKGELNSPNLRIVLTTVLNDMAEIHADIGNYEKAFYYNQWSSKVNIEYNLEQKEINSLITLGKIYYLKNNYDLAKTHWKQGLTLALKYDDFDLIGRLINNVGAAFYYEEEWDSCAIYFQKAYELHLSINNEVESVPSINNVGLVKILAGKYEEALFYLNESERLSRKHNLLQSLIISLRYQTEAYVHFDSAARVSELLDAFEVAQEEFYNQERAKKINEIEVAFEVEKKNKELKLLHKDNEIQYQQVIAHRRLVLFLIAIFTLSGILAYLYFLMAKNRQKNVQNQLTIKNLQTEQKVLRSQMNPHFIYNSLNSIQSFISSDESYQAEKYLARFAKLMRGILENSRQEFVVLDNEIEVLQVYLELEQLRFEKRFDFKINIDDDLETDFILIPPMLIQPFLENAILHGFKGVINGQLTLSLSEKNNKLKCIIDDNGIGRKAASLTKTDTKKQSLATKITEERLVSLSEQMGSDASFEIIDKRDEQGNATGTKVVLVIPIAEEAIP